MVWTYWRLIIFLGSKVSLPVFLYLFICDLCFSMTTMSCCLAFACVFRYSGARVSFLVLGEKSGPICAFLSCKKFFLFLVRIVSLLFCPHRYSKC
jgi:hypothetical protein